MIGSLPQTAQMQAQLKTLLLKREGLALALWGEPGIGKSHTARALLRETPCRSFSFHASVPLFELARALPTPAKLPAWAESFLARLKQGERLENEKAASALSALLGGLTPVILCLEDLHEASSEQLAGVVQLATMTRRTKGVALLVTSRIPPPEPFEALRLEPLDSGASRALLEGAVSASLPPAAAEWIYVQAQGNPLFTLEYLRHLARMGFLWNDGQCWRWRSPPAGLVPLTIEALIERQLLEVSASETARRALEARAILPLEAPAELWAKVAGLSLDELASAQGELERHHLLRAGKFIHPLFCEVRRKTLRPERKQALARRALEALRDDPIAAAAYLEEAGLTPAQALELLQRAAETAFQAKDEVRAARLLAQAVPYAGEGAGALALRAAQLLQYHDLPEALRLVEVALHSPFATPETLRLYVHWLARQGRPPDLPTLLSGLPEALRATVEPHSLELTMLHQAGDHRGALAVWEAHPELHPAPSPEALRAIAASALALGRMEQVQTLLTQAQTVPLTPEQEAEFSSIQALVHYHQGDYAAAEATIARTLSLLEGLEAPRLRATALVNRAAFLRMLGHYPQMNACLEEALHIRRQAGELKAYAFALAALAELLVEQGRYTEAEEGLGEAIAALELYGPSRFLINAHSMASLLYGAQDTPLARLLALKHAGRALSYARETGNPRVVREILFDASLAQTRAGHAHRGLELAQEALGLAEAAGNSPHDNFRTLWALGLALEGLGQPAQAIEALQEALAAAQQLGVPLDEHKLGLELDRLTGNLEGARRRLRWFEERGLRNGAHLARCYFPALNQQPPADAAPSQARPRLEVLGPLQRTLGEQGEAIRGQKRKELLAALLETRLAGRSEMSKLELLDHLYPGEDEERAASSLKELIHTVRTNLGALMVTTTPSGYALGAEVRSDLEEFLRTGETRLWRGVYLGGLASLHETVRESAYLALHTRAQALLEADPKEAARLGRILLEADPYDLEALRLTLGALRRSGNHKSLGRLYEEARGWMLEVGQTLPERWPEFLASTQG
ncbi:MAG: hypothetical protein K6T57_01755 [Thermaceae bacterium]|nr:hypothetical protein [Thermaceae bacterium]